MVFFKTRGFRRIGREGVDVCVDLGDRVVDEKRCVFIGRGLLRVLLVVRDGVVKINEFGVFVKRLWGEKGIVFRQNQGVVANFGECVFQFGGFESRLGLGDVSRGCFRKKGRVDFGSVEERGVDLTLEIAGRRFVLGLRRVFFRWGVFLRDFLIFWNRRYEVKFLFNAMNDA